VLVAAQDPVAVVVNLGVVRAPDDIDREIRGQAQADGGAQALRPGIDRAERRVRPVQRSDERRHLAATGEKTVLEIGAAVLAGSCIHGKVDREKASRRITATVERRKIPRLKVVGI
jgi:hypothetical protein